MKPKDTPEICKSPKETFQRSFTITKGIERVRAGDDDAPDTYEFKLSSDEPAEVWRNEFETLGHEPGEVRMDWVGSGNAPLLWMHDKCRQIGVIESARLESGFLVVSVRFGDSGLAQEKKKDVDSGILRNVSVGYRVLSWESEKEEDGKWFYRVTDWEPLEASLVTVPADKTVGFGRSESFRNLRLSGADGRGDSPGRSQSITTTENTMGKETNIDLDKERAEAVAHERKRVSAIQEAASNTKGYDLAGIADECIREGHSVEKFNELALAHIRQQSPKLNQADIGASEKEQRRYSLSNVMEGIVNGDLEQRAAYELEVSDELKKRMGKNGSSVAIPHDVLLRSWIPKDPSVAARWADTFGISRRDLQSVTLSGAGQTNTVSNVVETELLDEMFVYSLREGNALLTLGVNMIPGLVGDAEIPVELLNAEFHWVGEHEEPDEGDYRLGKVPLVFKTLGARIPFTRRAGKQSTPAIEGLLTRSLRIGSGLALERTIYSGAGTATEPQGILNTPGVGAVVSGGTYSRDVLVDLRASLGVANAATGPAVLLTSEHAAAEFVKTKTDPGSGIFVAEYSADDPTRIKTSIGTGYITNLLPSTGAGDPATVALFGKPSSVYAGLWGTMEIDVDKTSDRNVGGTTLRVWLDADVAVPQPACWSAITDLS